MVCVPRVLLPLCLSLLALGLWPLLRHGPQLLDLLPGFVPLLGRGVRWAEK